MNQKISLVLGFEVIIYNAILNVLSNVRNAASFFTFDLKFLQLNSLISFLSYIISNPFYKTAPPLIIRASLFYTKNLYNICDPKLQLLPFGLFSQ